MHRYFNPRRSIRARIALSFGAAALAFALAGGLYFGHRQSLELEDRIGASLEQLAFLSGADLAHSIDERHDDLVFAASLASFRDGNTSEAARERQREHLNDLQRWHPEFVWLGFAESSGRVRSAAGRILEEADVSARDWYLNGRARRHFGDMHDARELRPLLARGRGEATRVIDVATPVAGLDGAIRGVIGAHLGDTWVRNRLAALKRGAPELRSVELLLVARDGTLLVSSESPVAETTKLTGEWRRTPGGSGHALLDMGERAYVAGFHPVSRHGDFDGFGWTIMARQDAALALLPAARVRGASLLLAVAFGLTFAALGWLIAARLGAPLERITLAAARVRAGETVEFPESRARDEIGTLAATLQELLAGLKQEQGVIRARERELANIVETMVEGVVLFDAAGRITMLNAASERILGAPRESIVGRHYQDVPWRRIDPAGDELAEEQHPFVRVQSTSGRIEGAEFDIVTARGTVTTIQLSAAALRDERGDFVGVVATYADISERKRVEAGARAAQERLDRALEASKIALFEVDVRAGTVYLSESWSLMRGLAPVETETTVKDLLELTHPEDQDRLWGLAMSALAGSKEVYETELRVRDAAGDWIWVISRARVVERGSDGRALRMAGTNVDVTERKRAEQRIHYLNTRDALTDLSNRALFADRLEEAVATAHRQGNRLALLAVGLDRFTAINDSLGHDSGDQVLKAVAARISAAVGLEDVVGRPGGDEFLVLLARVGSPARAALAAEVMRGAVASPILVGGREAVVTMSVGIALYPDDGDSAGVLLRNAGTALNVAKEAGGNAVHFFAAHMNAAARARFETEAQMRLGLEREEFVLHFQPQVDLATGAVIGWEALVRWIHPERGLLPPAQFLPVADTSGLIVPLGEHVMLKACRQAQVWKQGGMVAARVAINVSAQQFRHPGFMKSVRSALASSGLDPRLLELEIVENALIGNEPVLDSVFEALGVFGVELAIDDFGTGYSNLSYLKRLPIDTVKIDQSFVRDVPGSPEACAIVQAVIAMAHGLGLKVVAEGIEQASQLEFLRQCGCDRGQGFLFGRPEPPEHWSRQPANVFPLKRPEARG